MAILVDEAIWPWRGRRWAHLVSDSHLDELHDLAHRLGLPYLAFQGDHYDVHEDLRAAAVAAGAVPTPGRELVRALRAAGLRRRGGPGWEWTARHVVEPGGLDDALGAIGAPAERWLVDHLAAALDDLGADRIDEVARIEGDGHLVLVGSARRRVAGVALGVEALTPTASLHRTVGERGTFVEVVVTTPGGGGRGGVDAGDDVPAEHS